MAERSKALVLGTSLFGGVGSNPTPIIVKTFFFFCDVEKNLNVLPCSESSSELAQRKRVGLITQRSQDRNLDSLITSRLAQLVERKTLNLVVEGSSPSVGKLFLGDRPPDLLFRLKTQTYVVSPTCGIGWMAERSKALV